MRAHFFIIGGQRCATTYLWHLLDKHPEIEMARPMRPEPKYFLDVANSDRSRADYASRYFASDTPLRGEKSTSYSDNDAALRGILQIFPKARFVMLLRDPVERAISNIRFSRDNGFESAPLEQALIRELSADNEPQSYGNVSVSPFAYLQRSRYAERLSKIADIVPREQICVLQAEKMILEPATRTEICAFLGVEPEGLGTLPGPVNAAVGDADDSTGHLSEDTLARLRAHFAPMVPVLQREYGIDPALWPTTCPGNVDD